MKYSRVRKNQRSSSTPAIPYLLSNLDAKRRNDGLGRSAPETLFRSFQGRLLKMESLFSLITDLLNPYWHEIASKETETHNALHLTKHYRTLFDVLTLHAHNALSIATDAVWFVIIYIVKKGNRLNK